MNAPAPQETQKDGPSANSFGVSAPSLSLPKGGGAMKGMGEKFAANPVTGTGSMSIPLAISPGRAGFGPALSLSYDSGAGNGPFGFGWQLSLPAITRKTDKGLPRYEDAQDSDVFIFAGAEDLVPELKKDPATGSWIKDSAGHFEINEILAGGYWIRCYRPRIEGTFARIERWARQDNPEEVFWRSLSPDNTTTFYGKSADSRIADPADPKRIFSWLICESYDDKGNAISYEHKPESAEQVDLSAANEQHRNRLGQRYLKHVKYGNPTSRQPNEDLTQRKDWLFEIVFDYGEHAADVPQPAGAAQWLARNDAFSSYRSGFEVRTHRLCQRVLMFHHFPKENIGSDCLVKSTDFLYRDTRGIPDDRNKGNPIASFLASVTHTSYQKNSAGGYDHKSPPPLQFEYSEAIIDQQIREVDPKSLKNIPAGLASAYDRWVDLEGEGIAGILSCRPEAWYYKRNLSPISTVTENEISRNVAVFETMERVATTPKVAVTSESGWQFYDLARDGRPDLVHFAGPVPGYFERNESVRWDNFVPFEATPRIDWRDPNLRFIDLTGDGLADILVTEDQAFTWYPSLGKGGFGPSERISQALNEERGPRLVFADGEEAIYLADFSGDGLTDLVRIRNGEVCYHPNLGYGVFGPKVTMDNSPWLDAPDQFSQHRIRLADVDGSGVTDIIYLGRESVSVYFNQSGNGWSEAHSINQMPPATDLTNIQVVDLFGNGTACLVWSSPLPGDSPRPMRYIDLMGGQKPHLLLKTRNNLGAETTVQYAPSTKYYLQDRLSGTPWITKLPFPVHCVEKVTVTDKWRNTTFSTSYSYHHGYFDGPEREFRGFGRIEQVDTEDYGSFLKDNVTSPYITQDKTLYQPPVKTITWFHTGAALDRKKILSQFETEYFPASLAALPTTLTIDPVFSEKRLPESNLDSLELTNEEWREAQRACKGKLLRKEMYELDVLALNPMEGQLPAQIPVRLFCAETHHYAIHFQQPQGENPYAIFFLSESEALNYHYELDVRLPTLNSVATAEPLKPDPRVAHTLNLSFDDYGNAQQTVSVNYPRWRTSDGSELGDDPELAAHLAIIQEGQRERHVSYREIHYTNDVIETQNPGLVAPIQNYRLRVPFEMQMYELTGLTPQLGNYFDVENLQSFELSARYLPTTPSTPVGRNLYHQLPQNNLPTMRLVDQTRTLFFEDDAAAPLAATRFLQAPRSLGTLGPLGLVYQQYKLALTTALLDSVFTNGQLAQTVPSGSTVRDALNNGKISGYLSDADATAEFGVPAAGEYWIRSGIAGFASDAPQHFYLPERYSDAFGRTTALKYDGQYDLYVKSSSDALGNTVAIGSFDYRVLAPTEIEDINGNYSSVAFDILGLPVASAIMGKGHTESGDSLTGLALDVPLADIEAFLTTAYSDSEPRNWLGHATVRYVYDFGDHFASDGTRSFELRPASACAIARETHVAGGGVAKLQVSVGYSDGMGAILVTKMQAEPDPESTESPPPLRWVASGKTVLNNKAKPVKKYEPYFSLIGHGFERAETESEIGVTSLLYYDALGRVLRTEMPDGTLSRVEFTPWFTRTFDANDTVLESQWYKDHGGPINTDPGFNDPEKRAAWLAIQHADTAALTVSDSLGREIVGVVHNRVDDGAGGWKNEKYLTFTRLDAEGKPLWIRDPRGNLVMQYLWPSKPDRDEPRLTRDFSPTGNPNNDIGLRAPCYDIAGNLLFQHSMDAGNRWMINDATGQGLAAWDLNERQNPDNTFTGEERFYFTEYDELHRTTAQWQRIDQGNPTMIQRMEYTDTQTISGIPNSQYATDSAANLIGQLVRHYEPSGLTESIRRDFQGNILEGLRRLNNQPSESIIDWQNDPPGKLAADTFRQITAYDALNRVTHHYNWHRDALGSPVAQYVPYYNERGLLSSEDLTLHLEQGSNGIGAGLLTKKTTPIGSISYDAKGQKLTLELDNGSTTRYSYDPNNFRLTHLYTKRDNRYSGDCSSQTADDPRPLRPCGLQNLHYTYDPVGNIVHIQDDAQQTVYFDNAVVEPSTDYVYDALYRLTSATGREAAQGGDAARDGQEMIPVSGFPVTNQTLRNFTESYTYDAVGNFVTFAHTIQGDLINSWTRNYETAPASNRLVRTWTGTKDWDHTPVNKRIEYAYDTHGNMLNLASVAPQFDLRWEYRDMIRHFNLGGGGQVHYQYDGGKQRSRKTIERNGSIVEERIYLGGYELYRRTVAGKPVEEIESHHLFEGSQRILLVDDVITASDATHPRPDGFIVPQQTLFRYQYSNHLGSASLELDDQAKIISYEEYHPYGTSAFRALHGAIKAPPKRYRYTGMERDEETGLGYHKSRYFAVSLGRWVCPDPLYLKDGLNVFSYTHNNPITFIDTTGTQTATSRDPWSWASFKEGAVVDGLIGVRQLAALADPFYLLGVTKFQADQEFFQERTAAHAALSSGDNEKAQAIAGGEYFRIYQEGEKIGASKGERAAVIVGHASGINQAIETYEGETRSGESLSGFKRFSRGVDAALRIASTVSIARGIGSKLGGKIESSAAKMDRIIERFVVTEERFPTIGDPELRELLIGLEDSGIPILGRVVEVPANDPNFGIVRAHGGAYHDLRTGTTYVNLNEVNARLGESGLENARQVILHEFGHFGQGPITELNAEGLPSLAAYYEREAQASLAAAGMARDPADIAALNAHAQRNQQVADALR